MPATAGSFRKPRDFRSQGPIRIRSRVTARGRNDLTAPRINPETSLERSIAASASLEEIWQRLQHYTQMKEKILRILSCFSHTQPPRRVLRSPYIMKDPARIHMRGQATERNDRSTPPTHRVTDEARDAALTTRVCEKTLSGILQNQVLRQLILLNRQSRLLKGQGNRNKGEEESLKRAESLGALSGSGKKYKLIRTIAATGKLKAKERTTQPKLRRDKSVTLCPRVVPKTKELRATRSPPEEVGKVTVTAFKRKERVEIHTTQAVPGTGAEGRERT